MRKKDTLESAQQLEQQLVQAELAERQMTEQALIQESEAVAKSGDDPKRYLVNQLIGRMQMANGFAKLATVAVAADLANVKDNKLYQGVTVALEDGKTATIATWEQFCDIAVGISRRTCDDLVANFKAFGPEAFDAMQRAGIGPTRFNKLRATLSDGEKNLVLQGIEVNAGDTEAIKTLVDDVIAEQAARHAKEKEVLEKKTKDLEGDLEATRRVVEDKNQKITELETEAHKRASMVPDEREAELRERLRKAIEGASAERMRYLSVIKEVFDWGDAPESLRHACAEGVTRLFIELEQLRLDYHLPITAPDLVTPRPELAE